MTRDIRLRQTEDFLSIVPYLLGYHPQTSIVTDESSRMSSLLRCVLPVDSSDTSRLADILTRDNIRMALVIGYGPGAVVTPAIDAVGKAIEKIDVEIIDMLRCQDNRYWSYTCRNPDCCPPEGTPYGMSDNPAAAEAVFAGLVVYPDREAFAESLSPATGPDRERVTVATWTACTRVRRMLGTPHDWYGECLKKVAEALELTRSGQDLDVDQVAWLGILLTAIINRDGATTLIGQYDDDVHIRLWATLTRRVEAAFAAAPAALLAFVAYRKGDGPLARIAVERSLTVDPNYQFALLTRSALEQGMPPSVAAELDCAGIAEQLAAQAAHQATSTRPILPEGW
jgi:hypothetical protein